MSALLEVAKFDSFNEIAVEEVDLPRFRMRASLAALLLATVVVSVLATLPASAIARACFIGN